MPRQVAKVGDVFWVPIEDGSFVLGQIVEIQKEALNSITCAFFNVRNKSPDNSPRKLTEPISVQFVTKDLFNKGVWIRTSNEKVSVPEKQFPYRETKKHGWVGATIVGSGIIRMFLSAFYGLRAWDEMYKPDYYQNLLLPGIKPNSNA